MKKNTNPTNQPNLIRVIREIRVPTNICGICDICVPFKADRSFSFADFRRDSGKPKRARSFLSLLRKFPTERIHGSGYTHGGVT